MFHLSPTPFLFQLTALVKHIFFLMNNLWILFFPFWRQFVNCFLAIADNSTISLLIFWQPFCIFHPLLWGAWNLQGKKMKDLVWISIHTSVFPCYRIPLLPYFPSSLKIPPQYLNIFFLPCSFPIRSLLSFLLNLPCLLFSFSPFKSTFSYPSFILSPFQTLHLWLVL